MRPFFAFFLLSISIFAQTERADQQVAKLRAVMQAEEQFLTPLNQSLSAVAEENGHTIDESYTYIDALEQYDYLFKQKSGMAGKIVPGVAFIAVPLALTVSAFLKKRFLFIPLASLITFWGALPTTTSAHIHPYEVVSLTPDCESINPYRHCIAIKAKNSFHYLAELHYKSASSRFPGSCFVWFRPNNLPAFTAEEGYALIQTDRYAPFFKATKLDYIIENCTHKEIFPEQVHTESWNKNVVATGVIALDRESPGSKE